MNNTDSIKSTLELFEIIEKLNHKLVIADTALKVLAKNGNEVAMAALEEMSK